jgi:acyl-CoA synthetase (AMP-forming)/AMP-acid ligase II
VSQVLRDERADVVCLEDVPNSRVWQHVKLWKRLIDDHDTYTVADLRSLLGEPDATFPHLDDLWKIAGDSPYVAHVQPDGPESLETCTVYYVRQTVQGIPLTWRVAAQPSKPWTEYTNRPATRAVAENLTPELRRHLQTMLPEYMVPSSVIMVDTIPLTHNGKIDREALARFDLERPATNSHYAPARTDIENRLVQVWAGVLGVERVGINDNFFEFCRSRRRREPRLRASTSR